MQLTCFSVIWQVFGPRDWFNGTLYAVVLCSSPKSLDFVHFVDL